MTTDVAPAEQASAVEPLPKVNPETMVLRGRPDRAIRFKRGVIVALAAGASLLVVAAAWLALKPRTFQLVSSREGTELIAKLPADALARAPMTYGDVPRLGPPLPGDLGRPILERQRQLAGIEDGGVAQRAEQDAAAERERLVAERKAARESGLLVQAGARTSAPAEAALPETSAQTPAGSSGNGSRFSLDPDRDPNAQGRKADFVTTRDTAGDINPHALTPPASPYMLSAGSVIAASLITGLRSDLPGLVTAQVTQNVYDSPTGQILLLPQGARLIGSYDSVVAFGQRRALVVWQRIILPDGSSLRIDNVPAGDASGYAGLADKVDFHTWSLLKGVALSTVLGVGAELQFSGESDLVQTLRQSTQQSVSRAGDQLTSRNLQVQPTITIRPGTPVRLIVHRDLVLKPWQENF